MPDEFMSSLPPPPRKGDKLFDGTPSDWHNNACISYWHDEDGYAYTEGYRRAALRLVEHVNNTGRDQDVLVCPIVFLYRHHIELVLKRIMVGANVILGRELNEVEKKHLGMHRLDLLWQDVKGVIAAFAEKMDWKQLPTEELDGVDDYIYQLVSIDPHSYSFRYATSKKGARSLPKNMKNINLRHFADLMERLASFLDGIDLSTRHVIEAEAELEAMYHSEMMSYLREDY